MLNHYKVRREYDKKILVTGGTVFVSKFVATYFKNHDYDVYVLNRGNRKQIEGVKLIKGDRHHLGNLLKGYDFDVVLMLLLILNKMSKIC